MGIPVGPDTSLVAAEAILSSVDQALAQGIPNLRAFRHLDDFELGFESLSDAESGLAFLQEVLSDYELTLNAGKTTIAERPTDIERSWALVFKRFDVSKNAGRQASDIASYFDTAFSLARDNPQAHVLNYAMSRLRGVQVDATNWPLLQQLLMQCLAIEPGAVVPILGQIVRYHQAGYPIDLATLENVMNSQIAHHSRFGHGSEVAWALWTAIVFDLHLDAQAASAVSTMDDSVVALLALDAHCRGLIPAGLDLSHWQSYMHPGALYEEQWLLSYEANVQGWLPSTGGGDHVASDPNFGFLKNLQVTFYDRSRTTPQMVATGVAPSAGTAPLFAFAVTEYEYE